MDPFGGTYAEFQQPKESNDAVRSIEKAPPLFWRMLFPTENDRV